MSSVSDRTQNHFFGLATQYYICGRFAVTAHTMPVGGNLLHHAIEMYLKGALALHLPMPELKKLHHGLKTIWRVFQDRFKDGDVSSLNAVVIELDRFEGRLTA